MVDYTPTWNLPYPAASDSVRPESRDYEALAVATAAGLTDSLNQGLPRNAHPNLDAGTNLDDITDGTFATAGTNVTNAPADAGNGFVHTYVNPSSPETSRIQIFWELGTAGRVWTRFRGSSAWTDWRRIDFPRAAERLAASTDLDDITVNSEYASYPGLDGILNAPPSGANGVVKTFYVQDLTRLQLYYELGVANRVWRRFRGTGSWTAWSRIDAAYAIEQSSGGGGGGGEPPSALKALPVALSASTNFPAVTVASGGVRFPLNVNAPITRWRLCIRNHNYRTGVTSPGGAEFTGLWVGTRSGQTAAFTSAPTQISGPFTLPAGGADFALPWVNAVPIGDGQDLLLSLGWTGAGEATRSPAGCYRSTSSSTGGATSGAGYTADVSVPFSWWIEVETDATTPCVAIWGDSISCGTGNDFPIHDSPLSQYCRTIGAIPYHAGYPGTNMGAWEPEGSNYHAWGRFAHLSRPDAVIHFMGQNDLLTADLAEMQRRFEATIGLLRRYVSPNVYLATLTPTSTKDGPTNTIRKQYNNWLKALTGGRDCFDFGAAVANGANDALAAWADSGDALHLSTAGSTALANAITRPIIGTGSSGTAGFMSSVPTLDDYAAATVDEVGRLSEGTLWDGTKYIPHLRVDELEVTGDGGVSTSPIDVVILAGQSNALYRWHSLDHPVTHDLDPRLMVWWQGQGQMTPIPVTHGEDVGKGFARAYLHANPNRSTVIVPCALGSTGFSPSANGTWDRTQPDNLYDDMIEAASACIAAAGDRLGHVMMLWVQGEADRGALTESQYAAYLDDLIVTARSDLSAPDMEVIVGSMAPAELLITPPANQGVARAHVDTPRRVQRTAYQFGPEDFQNYQQDIHYSNPGRALKGAQMFDALYRARLNITGQDPIMPHGLAITRVGDDVRITWEPPPCRFTAFNLEVQVDGGAWTAQTLATPVSLDHTMTVTASSTLAARISTTNETGTSYPSLEVTA